MIDVRWIKFTYIIVLSIVATVSLSGCSTPLATNVTTNTNTAMLPEARLPAIVEETSALVCLPDGHFLTINDSGHAASVFKLNARGEVLAQFAIAANNRDWEAMTIHQDSLVIGDIGNNSGTRSGGDLYQTSLQLDRAGQNPAEKTSFVYPDLPQPPLKLYQHDFDAEAIVSADQQLWLFNKAWQSEHSNVYQLTITSGGTTARRVAAISGLPGVITGGAFSSVHQLFVLTGYARFRDNVLNLALHDDYQPFLAVLDTNFKLQKTVPLTPGGQIEAICIDPRQQIWLTQEKSKRRPALLWRWGTMQQLLPRLSAQS